MSTVPSAGATPRSSTPVLVVAGLVAILGALVAGGLGFALAWRLKPHSLTEERVATIAVEVRRIARLATIEAREAQIIRIDDRIPLLYLFESHKNALLLVHGRVLAGVDLERAQVDVDTAARRITVRLPRAEILAVEPEFEFYSEESGFTNPITTADRTAWLKLGTAELRRAALVHGLRERATDNARQLITGLALGLGYTVRFTGEGPEAKAPAGEGQDDRPQ